MSESFDAYHLWLAIPPKDQPPHYYRLLGVELFEDNPDVISAAADQRMAHLRTFQAGKHSALSQKLLNEVSAARVCLLKPDKKAAYDAELRERLRQQATPSDDTEKQFSDQMAALVTAAQRSPGRMPTASGRAGGPAQGFAKSPAARWPAKSRLGLVIGGVAAAVIVLVILLVAMRNSSEPPTRQVATGHSRADDQSGKSKPQLGADTRLKLPGPGRPPETRSHGPGTHIQMVDENIPSIARSTKIATAQGRVESSSTAAPGLTVGEPLSSKESPSTGGRQPPPMATSTSPEPAIELPASLDSHYVNWIAFDREGSVMATAGNDGILQIRDGRTGELRHTLKGHNAQVRQVAFSPGGKTVASVSFDRTIKFWDPLTGSLIRSIDAHSDRIQCLAYSPDGRFVVTGANDQNVLVHDASEGKLLRTLAGHVGSVRSVVFSPDGRTLASGGGDHTVRLWDVMTGECRRSLEGHPGGVTCVAFSPDGSRLAAAANRTIEVWDPTAGQRLLSVPAHDEVTFVVTYCRNGAILASASADRCVKLWAANDGRLLRKLDHHQDEVCGLAYSPDGKMLVSGGKDRTIRFWRGDQILVDFPSRPAAANASRNQPTLATVKDASHPVLVARPEPAVIGKAAVPDETNLAVVMKEAEAFQQDYIKAENGPGATALAKRILQKADETKADMRARFVFLRLARDVAIKAGDRKTAFEAIDHLAASYEIDPWEMKAGLMIDSAKQARRPPERKQFAQEVLLLMQQSLEQDALGAAEQMGKLALAEGSRLRDKDILAQADAGLKDVKRATKAFGPVSAVLVTLREKPDDPEANLVFGRYQCFGKGDWTKGLKSLARGSDAALKLLAEKERSAAGIRQSVDRRLELGDAWWELAQNAPELDHDAMLLRAGYWYRQAAGHIESDVTRIKVLKRMEEVTKLERSLPKLGGHKVFTNSIGMQFVLIPAGDFWMGSTPEEIAAAIEEAKRKNDPWAVDRAPTESPRHRVRISRPFYLGMYEVTQDEYGQVMSSSPSSFSAKGLHSHKVAGRDTSRLPVDQVSWEEAAQFCRNLSAMPKEKAARRMYRLPTEAEWEYACRAGSTAAWSFGEDAAALGDYAWFQSNSDGMTHPVGQKRPNAWGLYDMHGSVGEWCIDSFGPTFYAQSGPVDPVGSPGGSYRVIRGGSWLDYEELCRPAARNRVEPGTRHGNLGFRVLQFSSR